MKDKLEEPPNLKKEEHDLRIPYVTSELARHLCLGNGLAPRVCLCCCGLVLMFLDKAVRRLPTESPACSHTKFILAKHLEDMNWIFTTSSYPHKLVRPRAGR